MDTWIIIGIIVVLIILFGLYVAFYRKKRLSNNDIKRVKKVWKEVLDLQKNNPEQAILRADKLLDHALKQAGYQGTMGEKLKAARHCFSNNHAIWSAHKLRNRIAHELGIHLTQQQVVGGLKGFKKAFYDLGIKL